ncbi:thymidylate synthase protein [Rhizobium phage RHph_I46]|uniref:Thymidylate synthase protein n=1 Tax=Rhizobium phage RHph_I1_9 TaxID=2509729 RepID=A0A7S5RJF2_9CAUD|nr:thymidylate synthase [Rhizobium phage RHph_I1_9]QIG69707.1 thymidylate synthase protein [Rhizobium phage RHph_I46]QIG70988.1 thymidylate synthase protein [Rhizobium phage RHph_I9]QIG73574.1 thymidylate synthase protein [Rhizobium phage RHph_I1_9]QIG76327.1 thymidylate synthase protein [Rhizobium phage RHph_I34]
MAEYSNFTSAFRYAIDDITGAGNITESAFGKTIELRNFGYSIDQDIHSINFEEHFEDWPANLRKPNLEYGRAFADWILSGSHSMPQILKDLNPVAERFDANRSDLSSFELPSNFSMFYGPRIFQQLENVIDELKAFPDTRRAWISVLDGVNDNKLLPALRNGDLKTVEYPCTIGFLFDTTTKYTKERYLNCTVFMRSQNMVSVWPYDYLIGTKLQEYVAASTGYTIGEFNGIIGSAHIYERDWDFCRQFLNKPLEWLE